MALCDQRKAMPGCKLLKKKKLKKKDNIHILSTLKSKEDFLSRERLDRAATALRSRRAPPAYTLT
jgi:hypothetical protein